MVVEVGLEVELAVELAVEPQVEGLIHPMARARITVTPMMMGRQWYQVVT